MTIHETETTLTATEVIRLARSFFTHAGTPYAAFPEVAGEGFLKLHLEVGEVVIAALPRGEVTWVRGSASRGAHLLTRFLATLGPAQATSQTTHRYRHHLTRGARVETRADREPNSIDPSRPGSARAA